MTINGSALSAEADCAMGNLRPAKRQSPGHYPADFAALARVRHQTELARHYGVNTDTIRRWALRAGVTFVKPPLVGRALGAPIPDDFVRSAPSLTRAQLKERYGVSQGTIARWIMRSGAQPKAVKTFSPWARRMESAFTPAVDTTLVGLAAQFLRRFYPAVYSCEILTPRERAKLPGHGKGLYIVGHKGALPADEVIALAEAKGFDQRAWARI